MLRMRSSMKKIDRGRAKMSNLISSLNTSKSYVKVGLLGDSRAKRPAGDLTNAELGIIHEFGTSRIPARPFIGAAFRKHAEEYRLLFRALVTKFVRAGDRSYLNVLGLLGAKAAADFKNFVTAGSPIAPPNAASTIARKSRRDDQIWQAKATKKGAVREGPAMAPRTLVDTGRMVGAITYAVVQRDAAGRVVPPVGKPINAARVVRSMKGSK